jgi:hypothetical protein
MATVRRCLRCAPDITLAVAGEVDDRLACQPVPREIHHQPVRHHLGGAERDEHGVERLDLRLLGAHDPREAEIVLEDIGRGACHRRLPATLETSSQRPDPGTFRCADYRCYLLTDDEPEASASGLSSMVSFLFVRSFVVALTAAALVR